MSWFKSRTFWGTVLIVIPQLLEAAGVVIPGFIVSLLQAVGGVLGVMGVRGAVLKAGGLQG